MNHYQESNLAGMRERQPTLLIALQLRWAQSAQSQDQVRSRQFLLPLFGTGKEALRF